MLELAAVTRKLPVTGRRRRSLPRVWFEAWCQLRSAAAKSGTGADSAQARTIVPIRGTAARAAPASPLCVDLDGGVGRTGGRHRSLPALPLFELSGRSCVKDA
jgi:hypothetical protein